MNLGTSRMGLAKGQAVIARLLAVAFLLASLLVPFAADAVPSGAEPVTVAASTAANQDGGLGTPSRPHGILHSGAHCACQLADHLAPPLAVAPTAFIIVGHPAYTTRTRASLEAPPPARPPRA
ncbi:hypothetical protein [Belnapia rosea]|uniref:DUF2946 domain-containing protein n=1 Tax=Belnapia rosea TaxID=938405 RepID=A0A1G6YZ81_9PROT|nr:hypothetical protein [Belnapia rosea]SDD94955.1 hypothetical protein SAMN04487779_101542 [Belnapia rosea]